MKIQVALTLAFCFAFPLKLVYGSTSKTIVLYPIADAYVDYGYPDNNYGGLDSLYVGNVTLSGTSFRLVGNAYLMFGLSGLNPSASIEKATLTFYVSSIGSTMKIYLHFCSDSSWNELKITWRNAPKFAEEPVSTTTISKVMIFYSQDATKAVKQSLANGTDKLTLVMTSEQKSALTDVARISSRESSEENRPRLEVSFSTEPTTTQTTKTESRTSEVVTTPPTLATTTSPFTTTKTPTSTPTTTDMTTIYFIMGGLIISVAIIALLILKRSRKSPK